MSFLKQILDEAVQGEMQFEDSIEDLAQKTAKELLELSVQLADDMMAEDPDLELDEGVLLEIAEGLFDDLFTDDFMIALKAQAPRYIR